MRNIGGVLAERKFSRSLISGLNILKIPYNPASADEHWKTANSALNRIIAAFEQHNVQPNTFFIAAAIENSMAAEIWSQLQKETLANAANLTQSDQIAPLCNWLIGL